MFPELFVGKRPRLSGNFFGLFQAVAPESHYAGTVGVFNFKPQSQLIGYGRHGQRFPVAVQDGAARRGNQQSHGPGGRARAGVRFPRGVQPSPPREGIRDRESKPFCSFSVSGHLRSGGHAFPFSGGRIGILFPVSQVNRFHSVILSALLHRSPASSRSPREDERRVEAWPQAVSAVHAANPANNTRERIRTFIFISLQECGKYTARNQRLFALTLIPER